MLEQESKELLNKNTVQFTTHSVDRMIKRYKGNLINVYLSIIIMIQEPNLVSEDAEWKGYKTLSFTFLHNANNITNKVVACFIKENKIRVITAMSDNIVDSLDYRLSENPANKQKLLDLLRKIIERYRK